MRAGFIGLGTQGKFLAVNIVKAGHDLMVFDVRQEPLRELADEGAKVARSNREVAQHAEIIEICVVDDAQVEDVVFGPDGVLEGADAGKIIVLHSTIHPDTVSKIAEAAKRKKVEVMDVAVSGGETGARNRTMCYMAGGARDAFERCEPLFRTSGSAIFHVGDLGAGIRAKLAHQVMICVNMLSAYEGMMLGVKAGVSPEALENVIHGGMAQSRVADHWQDFRPGKRSAPIFYKDLRLALEFAHSLGISLPATALTQQMIEQILRLDKQR
ncbi:MAG: NAD(P)-dependent oxidoreductase [Candidatus Binataceae bacterium]